MPGDLNALVARLMSIVPNDPGMMVKVIIPTEVPHQVDDNWVYQATLYEIPPTFFFGGTASHPLPDPDALVVSREVVTLRALNIRTEPDKDSAAMGSLNAGAKVKVAGDAVNGYVALAGGGWVLASGVQAT